jgi:hypothetical protein
LTGAIDSVLAQSLADFELVLSDNASDDDVDQVVARYDDARVRVRRWDEHVDIFQNFDRGLSLCTGEWVYLLPADDRLMPRCLEVIARRIDTFRGERDLVAVFPRAVRIDPAGHPIDIRYHGFQGEATVRNGVHDATSWLLAACAPGSPPFDSGAFRRSTLDEMGTFYRADIPSMSADLELTIRIAAYGDVAYVDEPLMAVTGSADSHTPGRVRANLSRRESFTPRGIAYAEGLEAHERRRAVGREERRAVDAAIARTHLRRATSHRTLPEGAGRRGALGDTAAAWRRSPRVVLRALPRVVAVVLAPAAWLVAAREWSLLVRERRRRRRSQAEPATTPGATRR